MFFLELAHQPLNVNAGRHGERSQVVREAGVARSDEIRQSKVGFAIRLFDLLAQGMKTRPYRRP